MAELGIVAIGRNEGERLRRCLESVRGRASAVVYVDSGSTDGSLEMARSMGVHTVVLDTSLPFTAARARNEGLRCLVKHHPNVELVQMVDGDCEVDEGWLQLAVEALAQDPETAVVCGRRRERHPDASIYNRLCDMEWDTPVGEAIACGGDAMMRVSCLQAVGGYRETLIAGEEPDLCVRLRGKGWKVRRLDAEMTLHDAAMTRFAQWWKRAERAGHAFAECSWLHRSGPIRLWRREARSTWFWGLLWPAVVLVTAIFWPWALLLLLTYPALGVRIYLRKVWDGSAAADAGLYALFCILGKFAQLRGQLRYHAGRLFGRPAGLIEYKGDARPSPQGMLEVAYLVNRYPHVSHSFMRREIRAVEEQGISVHRFSIRRADTLVDPADLEELSRTEVLLDGGVKRLVAASLAIFFCYPLRWIRAFFLATRMGWCSGRGLYRHWAYLMEACVLLRRLRSLGVCHVHAHFGTNAADVALLAHVVGSISYSVTIHGPEEFDRPEKLSLQLKTEQAAFVAAVSEFGRSQIFRWCSLPHWPKIHVVHCGVDDAFLELGPQHPADNKLLVCVGRICEQKGQLRLLQAAAVLQEQGVAFELVLAGDGPMRAVVEAEAARLGVVSRLRITGWLSNEQVRKHLLDARVMVLPSFAEGLPVVLMEALALGRPVITTYVAGIPELVQTGVNGWLVPAGSVEELAAAMRQGLEASPDDLARMGRAGSAAVKLRHDASQEGARLAQLLRNSIDSSRAALR